MKLRHVLLGILLIMVGVAIFINDYLYGSIVLSDFNPLTGLFEFYRHAVLYGDSPPAWQVLYPLAIAVLLFAVGLPLYRREQSSLAKLVGS